MATPASRILMISTSRELSPQPAVPIGAAWVAQALDMAGFQVKLLDLCFEREPVQAVARAIADFRPDGIGLSIRNLDNCDFLAPRSFLPDVKEITDFIKRRTDARILVGGAGASIMPLQLLEYLDLPHAVVGAGETAAPLFFGTRSEEEAAQVPGVVSRQGNGAAGACPPCSPHGSAGVRPSREIAHGLHGAAPCPPQHFPVAPQMHRWIDIDRYLKLEPVLPVQGKRGCANHCVYCTYRKIEGESWRIREPAAVADEISVAIRETGAREFEFVDSIFNQPEGYLENLLEEIMRRQLKAKFRVSSLSPKGLTKGQVRLMERAGMDSLVITPESACDVTLAALKKDFTEEEVHHAAELLSASAIKALWCFLMGGPQEDEATLGKTIGFINSKIPKNDCAFITTGIRIYPGTGLHQLAVSESVLDSSRNLLMPTFYFSHKITPGKAKALLKNNISDISRCIFLSDTQIDSLGAFRRMGTMMRLPGPFWRYAGYMNKIAAKSRVISRNWPAEPARKK